MSNSNRSPAQLAIAPEMPKGEVVGRYRTYAQAQEAVDYMSDEHFPVAMVSIIGSDLKSVEQVTGRLSYPRVALQGALNGVVFGAFFGLLMSMLGGANMASSLLLTMVLGGAFWMLLATITYALSRGKRDFTSTSRIVAGSYEVLAAPEVAGQARQVLAGMPGGRSGGQQPQGPGQGFGAAAGRPGPGAPHQGGQWGAPHGGRGAPGHGAPQNTSRGPAPRPEERPGQGGSTAGSAPAASGQPVEPAGEQDANRSAKFPDLPDGRPQYGIRVEPEAQQRPAPWTRPGDATGPQGGNPAEGGSAPVDPTSPQDRR
ncbi:general stress protein [Kocuria tytonis]|uniref:General stress protein 17M-like domain-containing protein n=1 Tax=Kocuria tytonis TaxID=2054280 RepID=A0A495A9N2_9MICC|nr:general stress protein [Kocuria tytonis]RKQ36759.1 hypothetical protein C1C97_003820 [Kocuria tytonis]